MNQLLWNYTTMFTSLCIFAISVWHQQDGYRCHGKCENVKKKKANSKSFIIRHNCMKLYGKVTWLA